MAHFRRRRPGLVDEHVAEKGGVRPKKLQVRAKIVTNGREQVTLPTLLAHDLVVTDGRE